VSGWLIHPEASRRITAIITTLREHRPDANVVADGLLDDLSDHDKRAMIVTLAGLWISATEIAVMQHESDPVKQRDMLDQVIKQLALELHGGLPREDDGRDD